MITPDKMLMLEEAATAAIGRKEMRCQVAMADLYKAAGLLPIGLEIPNGPRDAARWSNRSLFREWLEGAGGDHFAKEEATMQPGDLLCFHVGHVEHHVAILLQGGRLVHVFAEHGVQIAPCIPSPWLKRISSIWRLK